MYICEVVLKTAHETGESGRISRNHWEIGGIRGKLGENWGIVFPQWGNRIPWRGNQFPPHRGKKGENE